MSNDILIQFKVTKIKQGLGQVRLACPYCEHTSKTIDGFRKHLSRNHIGALGIIQVKKQASKLYRLYKEAKS